MSAKWEKLEGNEGILTIEVEEGKVNTAIDEAFKKVVKQVSIPGFRKGKVPRFIFEQRFGVEALYQDALDILLPEAYSAAIDETKIEPVDRPEVDVEQMEKGKTLIFTAKVTVKPDVTLGEYKGLEVEDKDANVTDEDVDNELKNLQERHAELVVKEEGNVENGDTVVMDFEGFVDGEPFEGGKAENYSLEIGSGQFIPGFEEQMVGMAAGEEKEIEVTFPEEYHSEDLAGKPAMFKVKVHEMKAKELPELDDEFAKDTDEEVESLVELKEKIKERLSKQKQEEAENSKRDTAVEKATENAEIDLPPVMVENEVNRMMQEFEQRIQMQGLSLDMYYQFSGQDENTLREQMKEDANKRVRSNLVLEAIAKAEDLQVTEEDIDEEVEKMAEMYQQPAENIRKMLGSLDGLKEELKVRKAIEFLVENSKPVA